MGLRRVLYGVSCRDNRITVKAVPEALSLSPLSASQRSIRATARKLHVLPDQHLDPYDVVALRLAGKTFADDTRVIALGITLQGGRVLLGFVKTGTESAPTCVAFSRGPLERGLRATNGVLVVLDGGKELRRAVRDVFEGAAQVQRCTRHSRENAVAYLSKHLQAAWQTRL